jgi:predicted nucleic acid-binding protein
VTTFIDTSALYALLDADDRQHAQARDAWISLLQAGDHLLTSNYIIIETAALIQNRLGIEAVRAFYEVVLPMIHVEWIDPIIHQSGVTALLTAGRRRLSLVDCVSFELMRRLGIRCAFAFDTHFAEQGFELIP